MIKLLPLILLLVVACSSQKEVIVTKVVTVEVPIVVSCVKSEDIPTKPDLSVPKLKKTDSDSKKVQALRIDNELSTPYQKSLEIIVNNCASISKE